MKKLFFVFVLLVIQGQLLLYAQKTQTVKARGSHQASSDLSLDQTKAKAIEDAKRNALNKAGVYETISFTDFSYEFEDNEGYSEVFEAISSIETGGKIIMDELLDEKRYFNEFGNMVVEVEIKATVYKYSKDADPAFLFKVDGLEEVYDSGDTLRFSVTPFQDAYLKIFNISKDKAELLYPYVGHEDSKYHDDPDKLFIARQMVQMPVLPALKGGYTLGIESPEAVQELNVLMFVFTKQNIPFIQEVTISNVMKWIYAIPPDQRVMSQEGFVIKRTQ